MNLDFIISIAFKLLAVAVLVGLNGFFVAAEFALVRIRETQLDTLIVKGDRRALIARHILSNLNEYLNAAQLGITLASLGLGWIGEPVFSALLEPLMNWLGLPDAWRSAIAVVVGFSTITFLHISAGESAPKALTIQKPLSSALFVALPLKLFHKISYPFIWILNSASLWMLRQIGIDASSISEHAHSEEELKVLLSSNIIKSSDSRTSRNIILNALDLRHRVVRDIMRPRNEIVYLDTSKSLAELMELIEQTRHSRYPLCNDDDIEKIIGFIHVKDLLLRRHAIKTGFDLVSIARKIIYVPELAGIEKLLWTLIDNKTHIAIAVDEYGSVSGLVTLENILEEMVGQIQDEFDEEAPLLVQISDSQWEISGALPIHELSNIIGLDLSEQGVSTVSGLVTRKLGGFPQEQQTLSLGNYVLKVEEMDGLRVARLSMRKVPQENSPPNDDTRISDQ